MRAVVNARLMRIDGTSQWAGRPVGLRGLAAILAATLTVACTGLTGSPKTDPGEVEQLKRRVVELQQRATVAELEGARLQREIARLEAELETVRPTVAPEAGSGQEVAPEAGSGQEVAPEAGSGQVAPEHEADPTAPSTIGLGQEIEETDLEETAPASAEPATRDRARGGMAEQTAAPATAVPSADAQVLYDEGYALFHQKRYADAETRFDRFVELYPETDLADNALFWIGESRYARGDFNSALEAFSATVERYPQSNKVADALLKAGKCLESLGDTQQARRTYQEVMDRYPGSAAAAQARDRLSGLR